MRNSGTLESINLSSKSIIGRSSKDDIVIKPNSKLSYNLYKWRQIQNNDKNNLYHRISLLEAKVQNLESEVRFRHPIYFDYLYFHWN